MCSDLRLLTLELDASGVEYEIKNGARHTKIYVRGKLVGILPRRKSSNQTRNQRAHLNVRAQIRRAIKE
jgi:hypothetical protein